MSEDETQGDPQEDLMDKIRTPREPQYTQREYEAFIRCMEPEIDHREDGLLEAVKMLLAIHQNRMWACRRTNDELDQEMRLIITKLSHYMGGLARFRTDRG